MSWSIGNRMELAQFFKQMAVLTRAGISLERALAVCGGTNVKPRLRAAIGRLSDDLRHGVRLSEAMRGTGPPFGPLHASTISANELGDGNFGRAFDNLATWEENEYRLRASLRALFSYPLFLCVLSAVGMVLLIRFLVPILSTVAAQLNHPLPLPAALLWKVGQALGDPVTMGAVLALVALAGCGARRLARRPAFMSWWAKTRLRLPVVGALARKAVLIRLTRVFQSLLNSGLPMVEALELAGRASDNAWMEKTVLPEVTRGVLAGERLSQALAATGQFPDAFVSMVSIGETTGRLPHLLGKVSDLYEMELDSAINTVIRALEPLLVAAVGLVVFVVMACAFFPMYELISAAGTV